MNKRLLKKKQEKTTKEESPKEEISSWKKVPAFETKPFSYGKYSKGSKYGK